MTTTTTTTMMIKILVAASAAANGDDEKEVEEDNEEKYDDCDDDDYYYLPVLSLLYTMPFEEQYNMTSQYLSSEEEMLPTELLCSHGQVQNLLPQAIEL